jgi:hypothetical protein
MVGFSGVDDPDQQSYQNRVSGAERNDVALQHRGRAADQQSAEPNPGQTKKTRMGNPRRLAEDSARPVIFYPRGGLAGSLGGRDRKASTTAGVTRGRLARQGRGPCVPLCAIPIVGEIPTGIEKSARQIRAGNLIWSCGQPS